MKIFLGDIASPRDLFGAVRTVDDDAIKRDSSDFNSDNGADGGRLANGNDLLLYTNNAKTTRKVPFVQRQNAPSIRTFIPSPEKVTSDKIQIKFNVDGRGKPQNEMKTDKIKIEASPSVNDPIEVDDSHVNDGFRFDGSPKRFGLDFIDSLLTTNPNRFPGATIHHHTNHQHQFDPHRFFDHHRNRFYANQIENNAEVNEEGKLIEKDSPVDLINYSHSQKI